MNKKEKKMLGGSILFMLGFVVWTIVVMNFNLQVVGPYESAVGFADLNVAFHKLTGEHMWIYAWTDWLSIIPAAFVGGFGLLGLVQLIKRKSLLKVDFNILTLGGFYIIVLIFYLFFEKCVVNYRPVLIEGVLEASYPSSTTMLCMCVLPTAMMQMNLRIKNVTMKRIVLAIMIAFTAFMVIGRMISGVHWLTDIIGGALLSTSLVMLYYSVSGFSKTDK